MEIVRYRGRVVYESCPSRARFVLSPGVTPTVLAGLLSVTPIALLSGAPGAQVKVNLMLQPPTPAPRRRRHRPRQAFGGTFHINETSGNSTPPTARPPRTVPEPLPCEIYCHSLTDPRILSAELHGSGAQTLTVFGLHTPHG